jgi:pimeloyl-ACP methyl ester carboxylesterase
MFADYHPEAFASLARSFAETDLRSALPHIDLPTLLLYGDADVRAPVSVGRALQAAIPGAELVVLPGVGHVHNLEDPARFNDAVRAFVRRVESA